MQVGKIQKVSSRDLEAKMCVYHVPNRWGRVRGLNYGIPKYCRTVVGYLPEHEFQEIDFLPGHSALGEWYCFSDVDETAQGLGLSHLFPCDTVGEEWTRFCLQFWKLFNRLGFRETPLLRGPWRRGHGCCCVSGLRENRA